MKAKVCRITAFEEQNILNLLNEHIEEYPNASLSEIIKGFKNLYLTSKYGLFALMDKIYNKEHDPNYTGDVRWENPESLELAKTCLSVGFYHTLTTILYRANQFNSVMTNNDTLKNFAAKFSVKEVNDLKNVIDNFDNFVSVATKLQENGEEFDVNFSYDQLINPVLSLMGEVVFDNTLSQLKRKQFRKLYKTDTNNIQRGSTVIFFDNGSKTLQKSTVEAVLNNGKTVLLKNGRIISKESFKNYHIRYSLETIQGDVLVSNPNSDLMFDTRPIENGEILEMKLYRKNNGVVGIGLFAYDNGTRSVFVGEVSHLGNQKYKPEDRFINHISSVDRSEFESFSKLSKNQIIEYFLGTEDENGIVTTEKKDLANISDEELNNAKTMYVQVHRNLVSENGTFENSKLYGYIKNPFTFNVLSGFISVPTVDSQTSWVIEETPFAVNESVINSYLTNSYIVNSTRIENLFFQFLGDYENNEKLPVNVQNVINSIDIRSIDGNKVGYLFGKHVMLQAVVENDEVKMKLMYVTDEGNLSPMRFKKYEYQSEDDELLEDENGEEVFLSFPNIHRDPRLVNGIPNERLDQKIHGVFRCLAYDTNEKYPVTESGEINTLTSLKSASIGKTASIENPTTVSPRYKEIASSFVSLFSEYLFNQRINSSNLSEYATSDKLESGSEIRDIFERTISLMISSEKIQEEIKQKLAANPNSIITFEFDGSFSNIKPHRKKYVNNLKTGETEQQEEYSLNSVSVDHSIELSILHYNAGIKAGLTYGRLRNSVSKEVIYEPTPDATVDYICALIGAKNEDFTDDSFPASESAESVLTNVSLNTNRQTTRQSDSAILANRYHRLAQLFSQFSRGEEKVVRIRNSRESEILVSFNAANDNSSVQSFKVQFVKRNSDCIIEGSEENLFEINNGRVMYESQDRLNEELANLKSWMQSRKTTQESESNAVFYFNRNRLQDEKDTGNKSFFEPVVKHVGNKLSISNNKVLFKELVTMLGGYIPVQGKSQVTIRLSNKTSLESQDSNIEEIDLDLTGIENDLRNEYEPTNYDEEDDDFGFQTELRKNPVQFSFVDNYRAKRWFKKSPLSKYISYEKFRKIAGTNGELAQWIFSGITLYKGSDNTDLYHESWHAFSQGMLSLEEKIALYNEVRNLKGLCKTNNGSKEFSKLSNIECEEFLAEEFRVFAMSKNQVAKTKLQKFFKSLKNIIKNIIEEIFGKTFANKLFKQDIPLKSYTDKIDNYFEKFYNGDIEGYVYSADNILFNSSLKQELNLRKLEDSDTGSGITIKTDHMSAIEASDAVSLMDSFAKEYLDVAATGGQIINGMQSRITYNLEKVFNIYIIPNTLDTQSERELKNKNLKALRESIECGDATNLKLYNPENGKESSQNIKDVIDKILKGNVQQPSNLKVFSECNKNLKSLSLRLSQIELDDKIENKSIAAQQVIIQTTLSSIYKDDDQKNRDKSLESIDATVENFFDKLISFNCNASISDLFDLNADNIESYTNTEDDKTYSELEKIQQHIDKIEEDYYQIEEKLNQEIDKLDEKDIDYEDKLLEIYDKLDKAKDNSEKEIAKLEEKKEKLYGYKNLVADIINNIGIDKLKVFFKSNDDKFVINSAIDYIRQRLAFYTYQSSTLNPLMFSSTAFENTAFKNQEKHERTFTFVSTLFGTGTTDNLFGDITARKQLDFLNDQMKRTPMYNYIKSKVEFLSSMYLRAQRVQEEKMSDVRSRLRKPQSKREEERNANIIATANKTVKNNIEQAKRLYVITKKMSAFFGNPQENSVTNTSPQNMIHAHIAMSSFIPKYLMQETESDEDIENKEQNNKHDFGDKDFTKTTSQLLDDEMKFLFSLIARQSSVAEFDYLGVTSLGVRETQKTEEAIRIIHQNLEGLTDRTEMFNRLIDLYIETNNILFISLANKIGDPKKYISNEHAKNFEIWSKFAHVMGMPIQNNEVANISIKTSLDEEENVSVMDSDGTVKKPERNSIIDEKNSVTTVIESGLSTRKIMEVWNEEFTSSELMKRLNYYVYDNETRSYSINPDTAGLRSLLNSTTNGLNSYGIELINILKSFGIWASNRIYFELENGFDYDVKGYHKHVSKEDIISCAYCLIRDVNRLGNKFKSLNQLSGMSAKFVKYIAYLDAKNNPKVNTEMVRNAEGESQSKVAEHNTMTLIISSIENAKNIADLTESNSAAKFLLPLPYKYKVSKDQDGNYKYEWELDQNGNKIVNEKYYPSSASSMWMSRLFNLYFDPESNVFPTNFGEKIPGVHIKMNVMSGVNISREKTKGMSSTRDEQNGVILFNADDKTAAVTQLVFADKDRIEFFRQGDKKRSYMVNITDDFGNDLTSIVNGYQQVVNVYDDETGSFSVYPNQLTSNPVQEKYDFIINTEAGQNMLSYLSDILISELETININRIYNHRMRTEKGFCYSPMLIERGMKFNHFDDILTKETKDKLLEHFTENGTHIRYISGRQQKPYSFITDENLMKKVVSEIKEWLVYTIKQDTENKIHQIIGKDENLYYYLGIENNVLSQIFGVDESGKIQYGDLISEDEAPMIALRVAALRYSFNNLFNTIEGFSILTGPQYQCDNKKNESAKRFGAMNSTGVFALNDVYVDEYLNSQRESSYTRWFLGNDFYDSNNIFESDGQIKTLVNNDITSHASLCDEYAVVMSKKLGKNYVDLEEECNAQCFASWDGYKQLAQRFGKWKPEYDKFYEKVLEIEKFNRNLQPGQKKMEMSPDMAKHFPPVLKLQAIGMTSHGLMPINEFHKYSILPLIPTMIEGTNLQLLHEDLMKHGVHYATFESASKLANFANSTKIQRLLQEKADEKNRAENTNKYTPDDISFSEIIGKYNDVYDENVGITDTDRMFDSNGEFVGYKPRKYKPINDEEVAYDYLPVSIYKDQQVIHDEIDDGFMVPTQLNKLSTNALFDAGLPLDYKVTEGVNPIEEYRKLLDDTLSDNEAVAEKARQELFSKSKIAQMVDRYNRVKNILTHFGVIDLYKKLGITGNDNEEVKKNKLLNWIARDLAKKGGIPSHVISEIRNSKELMDLSFTSFASELESSILSMYDKTVTRAKLPNGGLWIQAASTLFEKSSIDDASFWDKPTTNDMPFYENEFFTEEIATKEGIRYTPFTVDEKGNKHWKPSEFFKNVSEEWWNNEDGVTTRPAMVKLPMSSKFELLYKLKDEYGTKTIDEYDNKLEVLNRCLLNKEWRKKHKDFISLIGTRIPTQEMSSVEVLEIFQFTGVGVGNVIICPSELVVKSGGDYDIDKLTTFIKNIFCRYEEDGSISPFVAHIPEELLYANDKDIDRIIQTKIREIRQNISSIENSESYKQTLAARERSRDILFNSFSKSKTFKESALGKELLEQRQIEKTVNASIGIIKASIEVKKKELSNKNITDEKAALLNEELENENKQLDSLKIQKSITANNIKRLIQTAKNHPIIQEAIKISLNQDQVKDVFKVFEQTKDEIKILNYQAELKLYSKDALANEFIDCVSKLYTTPFTFSNAMTPNTTEKFRSGEGLADRMEKHFEKENELFNIHIVRGDNGKLGEGRLKGKGVSTTTVLTSSYQDLVRSTNNTGKVSLGPAAILQVSVEEFRKTGMGMSLYSISKMPTVEEANKFKFGEYIILDINGEKKKLNIKIDSYYDYILKNQGDNSSIEPNDIRIKDIKNKIQRDIKIINAFLISGNINAFLDKNIKEKNINLTSSMTEDQLTKLRNLKNVLEEEYVRWSSYTKQDLIFNVPKYDNCIRLDNKYNVNNEDEISFIISQIQNGCVDVAKDAWISFINYNLESANVYGFMLASGMNIKDIVYIATNPLVREYIKERSESKSPIKLLEKRREEFEKTNEISIRYKFIKKYIDNSTDFSTRGDNIKKIGYIYGKINDVLGKKNQKLNTSDLKKCLTADKNDIRSKKVLMQFFEMEDMAKSMQSLVLNTRYDAKKPKTMYEVVDNAAKMEALSHDQRFQQGDVDRFKKHSVLSSLYRDKELVSLARQLFPFRTNDFIENFIKSNYTYVDIVNTFDDLETCIIMFKSEMQKYMLNRNLKYEEPKQEVIEMSEEDKVKYRKKGFAEDGQIQKFLTEKNWISTQLFNQQEAIRLSSFSNLLDTELEEEDQIIQLSEDMALVKCLVFDKIFSSNEPMSFGNFYNQIISVLRNEYDGIDSEFSIFDYVDFVSSKMKRKGIEYEIQTVKFNGLSINDLDKIDALHEEYEILKNQSKLEEILKKKIHSFEYMQELESMSEEDYKNYVDEMTKRIKGDAYMISFYFKNLPSFSVTQSGTTIDPSKSINIIFGQKDIFSPIRKESNLLNQMIEDEQNGNGKAATNYISNFYYGFKNNNYKSRRMRLTVSIYDKFTKVALIENEQENPIINADEFEKFLETSKIGKVEIANQDALSRMFSAFDVISPALNYFSDYVKLADAYNESTEIKKEDKQRDAAEKVFNEGSIDKFEEVNNLQKMISGGSKSVISKILSPNSENNKNNPDNIARIQNRRMTVDDTRLNSHSTAAFVYMPSFAIQLTDDQIEEIQNNIIAPTLRMCSTLLEHGGIVAMFESAENDEIVAELNDRNYQSFQTIDTKSGKKILIFAKNNSGNNSGLGEIESFNEFTSNEILLTLFGPEFEKSKTKPVGNDLMLSDEEFSKLESEIKEKGSILNIENIESCSL